MADDTGKLKLKKPKIMDEFRDFISKGNVFGMAVGIIIGIAFGAVINSMVNDVIMPPVGLFTGGADFSDQYIVLKPGHVNGTEVSSFDSLAAAKAAGANTFRYGMFINTLINFLIIALVIFAMVKAINMMKKPTPKDPTTRACPECDTQIPIKAKRCPNCTTQIAPVEAK
jgi:large conductance mechanosensitive channel